MLFQINEPGSSHASNQNQQKHKAIGIDLGTTNSVVAISYEEKPIIISSAEGQRLLPSHVTFEGGKVSVGKDDHDATVASIRSIKRLMGKSLDDLKGEMPYLPYKFAKDKEQDKVLYLEVDGKIKTPTEIAAEILKAAKNRAQEYLKEVIHEAVITVPAYFDDAARTATKDAARLAGLDVLRLLNEPTAAAVAYGLDQKSRGTYVVYDLGGGTFDVSVLHMQEGIFQVLATGGHTSLGGDDIDQAILDDCLTEWGLKEWARYNKSLVQAGLLEARRVKEQLTEKDKSILALTVKGEKYKKTVTREMLKELIRPLVQETIHICRHTLKDCDKEVSDLDGIILVGGSTRIPYVREVVGEFFGKELLCSINPDEVVALGAAIQAEALSAGGSTILLDVNPLSLGLETMGGLVEKIIERNSPIPTIKTKMFTTYQDGQTGIQIHVVQGERELAADCRSMGKFELKGIPPMKAGIARVEVTFAIDADGLLTVSAVEKLTGISQFITVKPTYGLDETAMINMIRESLASGQEDMKGRLLIEARVDAKRLMNAVESAIKTDGNFLEADEKNQIYHTLDKLEKCLKTDKREEIKKWTEILEKQTKKFAERIVNNAMKQALKEKKIEEIESEF